MKKLLTWAAPALMASMLFVGCQKSIDSANDEGLRDGTSKLNGTCATCYVEGESTITKQTGSGSISSGINTQQISTEVSNTLDGDFNVKVTFERTAGTSNNAPFITVTADLNGDNSIGAGETQTWQTVAPNTTNPQSYTFTFELPEGFKACDEVDYTVTSLGIAAPSVITVSNTYSLWQVCGCTDVFNVALQCAGAPPAPSETYNTVTVTFTAKDAGTYVIQGGLNANAVIYNTGTFSDKFTRILDHPSINGKADVTRWEGELEACETVTIQVQFTGGTSIGSWSAKKVGGDDTALGGASGTKTCN